MRDPVVLVKNLLQVRSRPIFILEPRNEMSIVFGAKLGGQAVDYLYTMPMNKKDTSWGNVAGWYDSLLEDSDGSFQSKVIMPNLIRVLDPKKGMIILDVACGQGYFTRAFKSAGAAASGCDISRELIEAAKKHSPAGIDFHVALAHRLSFAASDSIDAVTIVLALQNIENMAEVLVEVSRVLKPGGRLIVVLNHPAFRIPDRSSWQWDEKLGKQYRRVDAYLSDAKKLIDMSPGEIDKNKKEFTVSFHRPLQSYVKAMNKAVLSLTRLEEWISHKKSQKGPRAEEEDRIRKEIPLFLMIEARKG